MIIIYVRDTVNVDLMRSEEKPSTVGEEIVGHEAIHECNASSYNHRYNSK